MVSISNKENEESNEPQSAGRVVLLDQFIGMVLAERYRIIELIGAGGWGNVYRAKHLLLDMDVAVKIVHLHLLHDDLRVKRFEQEAHLLSKIDNENIVRIIDHGLTPAPYIVMEFYSGMPLDKWLQTNGPMPTSMALELFIQLFDALSAAEELNIAHRDLKPSNILLKVKSENVHCKILDFGIAKFIDNDPQFAKITTTGEVLGSPQYMSPEHWRGQCDIRSDIYSLGCIMHETLAGKPPFSASSGIAYMNEHVYNSPKAITEINSNANLPSGLQDIVNKCLEKSQDNRYQSSKSCLYDLRKVKTGDKTSITLAEKFRRRTNRYVKAAALIIIVVTAVAIADWNGNGINSFNRNSKLSAPIQSSLPKLPESFKDKSIAQWSEAIEADPKNETLFFGRAILHVMRREYGEADRDFTQAIEINPNYAEAYAERAFAHILISFGTGIDQAFADADKAVALKPDYAHGHYARAYLFECKEQHEKAVEECNRAIALGENNTVLGQTCVYSTLSTAQIQMRRWKDALATVERGLKAVNPKYRWLLYWQRALMHCRRQEYNEALSDLDLATKETTCLPRVWSLKAIALLGLGKRKDAEDACAEAVKAEMSSSAERLPSVYRCRADFWREAGEPAKSIQDLDQAISLEEGKCAMTYRMRSLCKIQQGRFYDALADMKDALRLIPYSAKTLCFVAMLESKVGKKENARKSIGLAFALSTPAPISYVNRASIELDEGELQAALSDLNKAVEMNPYLKESFELRKVVYAKLGNKALAAKDCDKADHLLPEVVTIYP